MINFFVIKNYFKTKSKNNLNILTKLRSSRININGANNSIKIDKSNIKRLKVGIYGDNNRLEIHKNIVLRDTNIIIEGKNLKVVIDENCEIGGAHIVCAGEDSSILIGKNCLIASNIEIRNNDGHSIFQDGNIINPSANIHISDNVWICQNAKILKGANIGSNSVIALNALVTSHTFDNNVILAGNPAKIIKKNISWTKSLPK